MDISPQLGHRPLRLEDALAALEEEWRVRAEKRTAAC
jgi:hypothetical protein